MKDYLSLGPSAKTTALKKAAEELPKSEVIDLLGRVHEQAQSAQHVGGGLMAISAVTGFSVGEILGYLLKLWGASNLPLSGLVRDWYPGLRVIPHTVIAAILLFLGRDLDTKKAVIAYAAGLGLGGAAVARFADWLEHDGDLTADKEAVLTARVATLEARLTQLGQAVQ